MAVILTTLREAAGLHHHCGILFLNSVTSLSEQGGSTYELARRNCSDAYFGKTRQISAQSILQSVLAIRLVKQGKGPGLGSWV